jgi:hypothetical protein
MINPCSLFHFTLWLRGEAVFSGCGNFLIFIFYFLQFYISLAIIFVAEIVAGALAFAFKDKAVDIVGGAFKKVYVDSYQDDVESVMDHFQEKVRLKEQELISKS